MGRAVKALRFGGTTSALEASRPPQRPAFGRPGASSLTAFRRASHGAVRRAAVVRVTPRLSARYGAAYCIVRRPTATARSTPRT